MAMKQAGGQCFLRSSRSDTLLSTLAWRTRDTDQLTVDALLLEAKLGNLGWVRGIPTKHQVLFSFSRAYFRETPTVQEHMVRELRTISQNSFLSVLDSGSQPVPQQSRLSHHHNEPIRRAKSTVKTDVLNAATLRKKNKEIQLTPLSLSSGSCLEVKI